MNENMLTVYNTQSLSKEIFKPIKNGTVLMYVCGITAYDLSHIGHARSYITFDIIYRFLKYLGYDVVYVRNFTDVDDKIIKKANEAELPISSISEKFIDEFKKDMKSLSVLPPDFEPKATETIAEMINLISELIKSEHAYEKDGDVFFRVNSYHGYGKLSHKNIDELLSGARIPLNDEKESALDFALWKRSKSGEPSWDSPWGQGRPGWHIECSAMSMKFLGESIDIHGGGSDLIFPHHENEIAQTESFTGKNFVNYWIHNGFVNINNEKMSKSLKNFVTIRDLLSKYHPEVVRLFFLFSHYRSYIDFSYDGLDSAKTSLVRLYQSLDSYYNLKKNISDGGKITVRIETVDTVMSDCGLNIPVTQFKTEFEDAMCDDFNTPQALSAIFNLTRKVNKILNDAFSSGFIYKDSLEFLNDSVDFIKIAANDILGILTEEPESFVKENLRSLSGTSMQEEEILALIYERNAARKAKDFKKSDEIRNMLLNKGVVLEDSAQGTTFKIIEGNS